MEAEIDVGWKRPLAVFWSASLLSYLSSYFLTPILPFFLGTIGLSTRAEINQWTSWLSSATMFPIILSTPFWGMVGDRFGHKKMVMRAMMGAGICLFLTAFVTNIHQLLLVRIAHGFFGGFGIACMAYLSRITPRERTGQVFGFLQSAGFTAVFAGPAFGGFLANQFGFRKLYLLTGVIHLLAALTVFILIRPDRPNRDERPPIDFLRPLGIIWKSPAMRTLISLRFFLDSSSAILFPLLPIFIAGVLGKAGNDMTRIGIVFSVTGAGTVLGALLLGGLGDRIGHRTMFLACIFACALIYIPHAFVSEYVTLNVVRFLMGFFSAGIGPALISMVILNVATNDRGVTIAMVSSVCGIGSATAVYFGGTIVNRIGFSSLFIGLSAVFASVFIIGLFTVKRGTNRALERESLIAEGLN